MNTLRPVLLYSQTMTTRMAMVFTVHHATNPMDRWASARGMKCHAAHTTPSAMAAMKAPSSSCSGSTAYPDQPSSSQRPPARKPRNNPMVLATGIRGGGSGVPIIRIAPQAVSEMSGIRRMAGRYHAFDLTRPKSKDLFNRSFTPPALLSRNERIEAAATGQTTPRALSGRPGSN